MKDLKIPISKMRMKLICLDNFTPSPEIINLFGTRIGSDNSFVYVMVVTGELIFIVSIFNPSGLCLLKGNKVTSPWSFVTTPQGAVSQALEWQTCCMRSKSHEGLWPPLLKLKYGNSWLTSKCCGSSCKKIQFRFSIPIPIPGVSIPIPFSIPPISIPIPIPELELSCNSNSGIELTPTLVHRFVFDYLSK